MGVDMPQLRLLSGARKDVVHRLPCERLAAFGNKQPWKCILAQSQPAADRPQFIPGNRLFDAQAILET